MVANKTQICNMQGTAQALLLQFHHPRSFLPSLLHFNLTQSCPLAAANTKRIVPQVGRLRSSTRSGRRRSRPTNTRFDNNKFGGSALFTSFCSLQGAAAAAMEQQQVLADTDDVSHLSHVSAHFLVLFSSQYFLLLLLPLGLEFAICLDCFLDSAVLSLGYMKGWLLCWGHSFCVCFELVGANFSGWVG
jgi:hypothetical protein